MRLIDADKAERDIEELRKSDWFNAPYLTKERKIGLSEAFDMIQGVCIKHAPTVDAQPVRHGKWKKIRGAINCSACKSSSWSMSFEGLVTAFNYCPNCGAKMDAEQKKPYFPKGFFSKERPLAKGEKDESD